ncbi:hypothetical protein VNO77_11309 [Canavalia gladiata]|uniref:Uncharacterized protein n=1 Tax=Canavalia gladiata TaxID=3824 RepID=A0AAN9MBC7_CANGL
MIYESSGWIRHNVYLRSTAHVAPLWREIKEQVCDPMKRQEGERCELKFPVLEWIGQHRRQEVLHLHHVHAVTSALSKRMIKEPTLPSMTCHPFIGSFYLVGIHTNTPINNSSHSHSFSLSLSHLCFSLCRISQISQLSYLLCF